MTIELLTRLVTVNIPKRFQHDPNDKRIIHRHDIDDPRYKFVNLTRLLKGETPTFKFRQHAGTVDFDEIARRVHFIVCLVKAAEKKAITGNVLWLANLPDQQGQKYNGRAYNAAEQ
jgi:hypothetical protein